MPLHLLMASVTSGPTSAPADGAPVSSPIELVGPPERGRRELKLRTRLVLLDAAAILVAWALMYAVAGERPVGTGILASVGISVVTGLALLAISQLYRSRVSAVRSEELVRLGPVSAVLAVAVALSFRLGGGQASVLLVVGGSLACFLSLVVARSMFDGWLRRARAEGRFTRPILIVGSGPEATQLEALLAEHPEFGYVTIGFVGPHTDADDIHHAPVLGGLGDLERVLDQTGANGVLLAAEGIEPSERRAVLQMLSHRGVHVHISGGLWGVDHRRIRTVPIAHEPLLYIEPPQFGYTQLVLKRALDIIVSVTMLVLTAPLMAVASLAVRLDSPGPVIYRQARVGKGGRVFRVFKLRTMVDGADRMPVECENGREGPLYKSQGRDPRITRVGHWLRAASIDELPQLLNVLRGEMSLVGPRPALPSEVENFDEELQARHRALPGITGLWQVEARDKASFWAYRRLDLFYVENWSLLLDIVILVLTLETVVQRTFRFLRGDDPDFSD